MKSIGMYSKSYSSGKEKNPVEPGEEKNLVQMAPAQVSDGPRTFSNVVAKSPPKAQQPLPAKAKCEFCENKHWSEDCPTFLAVKTIAERRQLAMRKGLCFRCMRREKHIAIECKAEKPKCSLCSRAHKTCFHPQEEKDAVSASSTSLSTGEQSSDKS